MSVHSHSPIYSFAAHSIKIVAIVPLDAATISSISLWLIQSMYETNILYIDDECAYMYVCVCVQCKRYLSIYLYICTQYVRICLCAMLCEGGKIKILMK